MARKLTSKQLGWILLDKKHPLKWRKEVLPVGHWEKLDENGEGLSFDADEKLLSHLVDSVNKLRSNGVTIPYAKSHDGWELAENKYGEIVGASVGRNSRGKKSFFIDVQFDSESAAKECTKTDSSVGIPDKFFDGAGNEYHHPLRHVAATNAPVIPGLGRWQAIAASFAKQINGINLTRDGIRGKGDGPGGGDGGDADAIKGKIKKLREAQRKVIKAGGNASIAQSYDRDIAKLQKKLKGTSSKFLNKGAVERAINKLNDDYAEGKVPVAQFKSKLKKLRNEERQFNASSISDENIELGESDMLAKLAAKLGIDIEGMSEEEAYAAIESAIDGMKGDGKEMSEDEDGVEDDDMEFSDDLPEDEEIGKPAPKSITKTRSETIKMSSSPLVIKVVRDNRRQQIQSLVENRKIDSATGKTLLASFCGDKRISLELSEKRDSGEFDRTIKLLAKNDPLNLSGRSGKRPNSDEFDLECSFGAADDDIVIKDAERRAKEAAAV